MVYRETISRQNETFETMITEIYLYFKRESDEGFRVPVRDALHLESQPLFLEASSGTAEVFFCSSRFSTRYSSRLRSVKIFGHVQARNWNFTTTFLLWITTTQHLRAKLLQGEQLKVQCVTNSVIFSIKYKLFALWPMVIGALGHYCELHKLILGNISKYIFILNLWTIVRK